LGDRSIILTSTTVRVTFSDLTRTSSGSARTRLA